jgi:hypothetical protein
MIFISMITGGNIVSDLVGIAAGHLYFYLKDLAPINHAMDILKTPQFLVNYFDRPRASSRVAPVSEGPIRSVNNSNASGNFGANSSTQSATYRPAGGEGTGNEFRPFQGRGTSWGH